MNLPFITSKYTGPPVYFVGGVETHPGPLDDGTYHGAFQDLRVEVRRLFWAGPIPVAPFIGASFPTHDYETVGEAVPGRHRRDLQIGANVGVNLDRLLSGRCTLHGRYGYATAQRIEGFAFTRSNVDVEVGFPIASRVVLRGLAGWQIRHQGPSVQELTVDWEHHDRFIAPSYTNLGVGASVADRRRRCLRAVAGHGPRKQWRPPRANNRRWRYVRIRITIERAGRSFCDSAGRCARPSGDGFGRN